MSLTFSKEDVRKHLLDLGYTNISKEQLKEFMNDLKRLIRYEEKQKRIEAHINYVSKKPTETRVHSKVSSSKLGKLNRCSNKRAQYANKSKSLRNVNISPFTKL